MANGKNAFLSCVLIAFFCLGILSEANAQILPSSLQTPPPPSQDSIRNTPVKKDTFISPIILAYPVFRPWQKTVIPVDELTQWHQFDPLDAQPGVQEFGRLNNIGTAAYRLQPTRRSVIGFDTGFHAYDPYLLNSDSLIFFNAPLAFTDVAYSQGPTSEDGIFTGTLARRFGKGTDFRIDALRIYNLGKYSRLANHHSSLRVGLRYLHLKGRYSIALMHGNHYIDQEENGGIRTDTLFGTDNYEDEINIPIFLTTAETRYRITDYQVAQAYALAGKVDRDSLGRLIVFHRLRWQDRGYTFSDTDPAADSLYYGNLQTDQRGIRQHTSWTTLSNTGEVLASWRSAGGSAISFQGGIEHRLHRWANELNTGTVNNLLLLGELDMRWKDQIDINGRTQFDLGDQAGSWMAEGAIGVRTGRWGALQAGLHLSQRFPDLIQQQLVISQRLFYDASWAKPQQQSLFGTLQIKPFGLSAGAQTSLLTNTIVFRDPGVPEQVTETVSVNQFWVSHHLKFWALHIDNKVSAQSSSDDRIRYPGWITRHQIYYEGKWFKKTLRTQIGLQARLISPWSPYGYQPVSGQFFIQDSNPEEWNRQIDGFFSMERLGFRAYLQFDNIGRAIFGWKATATNGVDIPQQYSTVAGYPQPETWMRWGIAFRFRG